MYRKTAPDISEEDEARLKAAVSKLNELLSNHSSAINGDPVVFKSVDELMTKNSRKGYSSIPSEGAEGEDGIGQPYFKDDLTNYSKHLGLNRHTSFKKR